MYGGYEGAGGAQALFQPALHVRVAGKIEPAILIHASRNVQPLILAEHLGKSFARWRIDGVRGKQRNDAVQA
jgi:hypothetical protein